MVDIENLRKLLVEAKDSRFIKLEADDSSPGRRLLKAAVNALPRLLDEVERLRKHLAQQGAGE